LPRKQPILRVLSDVRLPCKLTEIIRVPDTLASTGRMIRRITSEVVPTFVGAR